MADGLEIFLNFAKSNKNMTRKSCPIGIQTFGDLTVEKPEKEWKIE